jgi:transcriptional regulator with XRE-family HTH domain
MREEGMSENFPSGGIPMVKIDGAKIRQLRESKGLTQLYLATAVEVTTDTISRWENRRYPTIKKENGLRLAEVLEVELDDILDHSEAESQGDEADKILEDQEEPEAALPDTSVSLKKYAIISVSLLLVLVCLVAWWFSSKPEEMTINASRLLPIHTAAGQPFPVAITVNTDSATAQTLILKETLPPGAELIASIPKTAAVNSEEKEIKWLRKITGKHVFVYIAKVKQPYNSVAHFSGTIAARQASGTQITVSGNGKIVINSFHWADSNGDGLISDEEILTVYDTFSEIDGLDLDIDQVEEMWLGSGYRWDDSSGTFVVLP